MNLKKLKDLIKKIKENRESKNLPFRSVQYRQLKKELTNYLLERGLEFLEVGENIVILCFTNKDKSKPYTSIYSKKGFVKHKNYDPTGN
jgi:hypothetical protein